MTPGKRGVTYRYWDWNRRYDAAGARDDSGTPRALHVADALAVTDWDAPRGDAFVGSICHRAGPAHVGGPAQHDPLSGPGAPRASRHLEVARLHGTGALALPACDALRGLTVVEGAISLEGEGFALEVAAGHTAAIPAAATASGGVRARLDGAHALLTAVLV